MLAGIQVKSCITCVYKYVSLRIVASYYFVGYVVIPFLNVCTANCEKGRDRSVYLVGFVVKRIKFAFPNHTR